MWYRQFSLIKERAVAPNKQLISILFHVRRNTSSPASISTFTCKRIQFKACNELQLS